ncbi:Rieske 2Fe-2S domain-containing protein [Pseudomonas sp. PWP3-1b2]|uniref:Rieske 2Fe-2S domain-containing protein n=1 Tax=Pseudomonas sp. PWP3-1b2 TaxID=2804656 RepID=UPI003CEABCC4
MTVPSPSVVNGAKTAMRHLANRDTPFIFNEWYVAAFSNEVSRTLLQRTILGRTLVLFRTEAGAPIALDNRCPHRSFPLSAGRLVGDTLICGYHGFRYDAQGTLIEAPSVAKCPRNIGVRDFPMVERGSVIWIWMGDPALAAEEKIPHLPWMESPHWAGGQGYYALKSSYVSLHENLLDTSHLSFMHENTIGSPDYVRAPTVTEINPGRYALIRTVEPTRLPPVWGKPTGLENNANAGRIVRNEFLSPAVYEVTTRLYDGSLPAGERPEYQIKVAHFPTPESATSTHYFIYLGRDFAQQSAEASEFMATHFFRAFDEDVVGLALVEEVTNSTPVDEFFEVSIASDALGIAMRRYLKERADSEQSATPEIIIAREAAAQA